MTTTPAPMAGFVPSWDLSDRMTKALRVSGIGVQQMADTLGVTRETVGRWINGRGVPKAGALIAWAALTGVDLGWLRDGETLVRSEGFEPPTF